MGRKIRYFFTFVLLLSVQQAALSEDDSFVETAGRVTEEESDPQLQLNKEALISKGSTEEMRVKAANLLLFSDKTQARAILIDVLRDSENNAARMAVCRALSFAGASQKEVKNSEDFIYPLVEILSNESDLHRSRLAAEASILFDYDELCEPLGRMVSDSNLSTQTRLNAIYALKLQPDKRAVSKLIDLLNDKDQQVALSAKKALEKLGLPVQKGGQNVEQLKEWLSARSENEFLRSLVIRSQIEARNTEDKQEHWKNQYLDVLDKYYYTLVEDRSRAELLSGCLKSPASIKKLWALDKISEWRRSTKPKLPGDIGPILISLLSDPDRDVRLRAASLLSLMGQLNSAQKLLDRLNTEEDEEVKMAIFVALRLAVSYSSLAESPDRISLELRKETLKWAANYLSKKEPAKVQEGAVAIKKILEQNQMPPEERMEYLNLLAQRYKQESVNGTNDNDKGSLRAILLNNMSGLCASGSDCKAAAEQVFRDLFLGALDDQSNLVREAAVEGLININKREALNRFRQSDLISDASEGIRKDLVNLAGEVGDEKDLNWLWEKVGTSTESDLCWSAMLNIFERSVGSVVQRWIEKFNIGHSDTILSVEQQISFLEMAEQKVYSDGNNKQILKGIWRDLATLHGKMGKYQQVAEYLGKLRESFDNPEDKKSLLPEMLNAYLRWPNTDGASKLLENCLLAGDLEPNSPVLQTIENYLNEPPTGADPNEVLRSVVNDIKPVEERPVWQKKLQLWLKRLDQSGISNKQG